MDLVRKILLALEAAPPSGLLLEIEGYQASTVGHHCHLMADGGLILAIDATTYSDLLPVAIPRSLTWQGHEFLATMKDDTIWAQAKENVLKPAGGVAFTVLKDWLIAEAKVRLGLP